MNISTISDIEFVTLVAHYNDSLDSSKNGVSDQIKNDSRFSAAQLAEARDRMADRFNPVESCNLRFMKPFGHLKFESFGYVLTLLEAFERGCLPFEGSISDQPGQIMDIFSVLKQLKHEAEVKARTSELPRTKS